MIIKCKKKAEDYKPVKGNEKEIINQLLKYNYYEDWCLKKMDGILYFDICDGAYFNNKESNLVKCESDRKITHIDSKYKFIDYTAVLFNIMDKDTLKIFQAPNFVNLERASTSSIIKKWVLKTKNKSFTVRYDDILIFDKNWEIVDCLTNNSKYHERILESHDYIVDAVEYSIEMGG